MPISRGEFEHGEFEPFLYIEELLHKYEDTAFTADELLRLANDEGRPLTHEQLLSILDALVKQKRAECKEFKGIVYYIYKRRQMGFRAKED